MSLRCPTCNHLNTERQDPSSGSGVYCEMCGTELVAPTPQASKPPRRGWPSQARRAQQRYGAAPLTSDRDVLFDKPGSHLKDDPDFGGALNGGPAPLSDDPFGRGTPRSSQDPLSGSNGPAAPTGGAHRRRASPRPTAPTTGRRRDRFNEADLSRAADGIPGAGKPTPSPPPAMSRGPLPIPETNAAPALKPAYVGQPGAPRKSPRALMVFLLICILACAALGVAGILFEDQIASVTSQDLWQQLDQTSDDLQRAASDLAGSGEPSPDDPPAPVEETIGEPREVGKYIERVHTRPDGSKVRVWTPRELETDNPTDKGAEKPQASRVKRKTSGQARRPKGQARRPKGQAAYNFSLRDDQGRTIHLNGQRGKVVVLNFYANWCPPCRAEIPDFARFAKTHRDVAVYGILMKSGPFKQAAAKSRDLGVTYPILNGTPAVGNRYNVTAFPTTVIIDANGRQLQSIKGGLNYSRLKSLVNDAR